MIIFDYIVIFFIRLNCEIFSHKSYCDYCCMALLYCVIFKAMCGLTIKEIALIVSSRLCV